MSIGKKVCAALARACVRAAKNVWVFLAALWCVQCVVLYVAVSDVKIPERFVAAVLESVNGNGFRCSAGEVRLRNLTVLTAGDVRAEFGGDPVLKIRRCAVKLAPEALLDGNFIPLMLRLSGVEVYCPASNSSTGAPERLISSGALSARREGGTIFLDSAVCTIGGAKIVACGRLPGSRDFFFSEREKESSSETSVSEIAGAAGRLSELLRKTEIASVLDSASVFVRFSPEDVRSARAEAALLLREANFFENLSLKKVIAEQDFVVVPTENRLTPSGALGVFSDSVSFVAGKSFSEKIFGEAKRVSVAAVLPEAFAFSEDAVSAADRLPRRLATRVDSLRLAVLREGAVELRGLLADVEPAESWLFPEKFSFRANVSAEASRLAAAGTFSAASGAPSLNVDFEAVPDKGELLSLPRLRFLAKREELSSLRFSELPRLRGNAVFSPGMKFEKSDFEFLAGTTWADGRLFRSLRVAGTLAPESVRLPEIRAVGPDFTAHADVFTEFSSEGDFRVRTWGSVDPSYIDGALGWFWERIWRDLRPAPAEKRPRADIDVRGNWGENWEYVFGAIAGENCWANGMLVDKVRLRVYEDPLLIAAFDMRFERGNDLVTGNLQWHYAMEPTYHYRDFRFLFRGSIPPKDVLQIVGEGLPEALSEIETEGAGTAVASGFFSGDEKYYPERLLVSVRGEVPGAFSVFGIRGENFRGEITYDDGVVFVGGPFIANAGEGVVSGTVRVTLPEDGHSAVGAKAEIALDLRGVSRSRLTEAFSALGSRVSAGEEEDAPEPAPELVAAEPAPEGKEAEAEEEKPDTSSIDAVFAGSLTIPDLDSLDASGEFLLREPDLFELQIFGGFSRLLSAVKLDLTTFNLDRAEGSYTVRRGKVFLPDLHIFGESGEIFVQADIELPDLKIDGEAVFRNLRGTRIPLFGKLVEWGSSTTELLPVKISGTADAPEWEIEPTISRIWSRPEKKFGIAPEKNAEKSPVPDVPDEEDEE